ncbi:hypothetical protein IKD57_01945 [Candidatus Saccharibacteria bacterium]|nr:hypothetical protein [Candidatus Saccharibacteria bacterium]
MLEVIISAIVISLVGTLAHFLYDIINHNKFIGLFTAVNESTWEHIKIALTPILLCGLYDGFVHGENPNYFLAKLVSLVTPIIIIPCIFYGYKSISKKPILVIDILSFYLVIFLSQFLFKVIIDLPAIPYLFEYLSCAGLFVVFGAYCVLTLMPLKLFIFKDPISKKYGFRAHTDTFNPFKKKK